MKGKISRKRDGSVEYTIAGKAVTKDEFDLAFPSKDLSAPPMTAPPSCYPCVSTSLWFPPDMIDEVHRGHTERGLGHTEYKDGRPIYTSSEHRRRLCEAHGLVNLNGGYGDAQRR